MNSDHSDSPVVLAELALENEDGSPPRAMLETSLAPTVTTRYCLMIGQELVVLATIDLVTGVEVISS